MRSIWTFKEAAGRGTCFFLFLAMCAGTRGDAQAREEMLRHCRILMVSSMVSSMVCFSSTRMTMFRRPGSPRPGGETIRVELERGSQGPDHQGAGAF